MAEARREESRLRLEAAQRGAASLLIPSIPRPSSLADRQPLACLHACMTAEPELPMAARLLGAAGKSAVGFQGFCARPAAREVAAERAAAEAARAAEKKEAAAREAAAKLERMQATWREATALQQARA